MNKKFKKIIICFCCFLLISTMCFSLCGCSLLTKKVSNNLPGVKYVKDYQRNEGESDEGQETINLMHKVAFRPVVGSSSNMKESEASFYEVVDQYNVASQALLTLINCKYNLGQQFDITSYLQDETAYLENSAFYSPSSMDLYRYDCLRAKTTYPASSGASGYYEIDTTKHWNWNIGYDYVILKTNWEHINIFETAYDSEDESIAYKISDTNLFIEKSVFEELFISNFLDLVVTDYRRAYTALYSGLLEMAIFDILLGLEPTDYDISISSDGVPMVNNILLNADADADAWVKGTLGELSEARAEKIKLFNALSTNIGFSDRQVEQVVDYLLNDVIGTDIVSNDVFYDRAELLSEVRLLLTSRSFGQGDEKTTNKALGDAVSSAHSAYARVGFIDCERDQFNIHDEDDGMGHIEAREYSSAIIMSEDDEYIAGIWVGMEAEHDMEVTSYLRFYDSVNKKIYVGESVKFNVRAGLMEAISDNDGNGYINGDNQIVEISSDLFGDNKDVLLKPFTNNSTLEADTVRFVSSTNRVYKTIDSVYGYGSVAVLDEQYSESDFLEIVFDVKRDASKPFSDYRFKFCIIAHMFDSARMQY